MIQLWTYNASGGRRTVDPAALTGALESASPEDCPVFSRELPAASIVPFRGGAEILLDPGGLTSRDWRPAPPWDGRPGRLPAPE
ncbi:hypothetical protein [Actinoplanes derwentensis]|uniref:Uncharacterized protein n=1 Tax=Actinoplanes derwentensis TaxID=113562 RepID=A0A1H2ABL9_9ACTN|nr:hypothetical protein [Actinoplanes derwentensis]GID88934.1 hypothetical protein Ade03nite_78580 [Actinoplanes derwentensis]SDT43259.1 hypothetical protein SAMN04489716_3768 [Actinoplanes derwentensis]